MPSRIEDYAIIGDCETAALVGRDGSIDWLCLPRFDSGACFAALLGTPENGRWLIAPRGEFRQPRRGYRDGGLILETDFETDAGAVAVVDWMPMRDGFPNLVRKVVGRRGKVAMRTEVIIRFDYGALVPWVQQTDRGIIAVAGPDCVILDSDVPLRGEDFKTLAEFEVAEGQEVVFVLTWYPSAQEPPARLDAADCFKETDKIWRKWSARCTYDGEWKEPVLRSLVTLKALTYEPTGGIVAAATTSLPEQIGGVRNWDYRFCWLRDATFTLYALLLNGYLDEARAWREWLVRAVAGKASQLNIMYGVAGERRLTEIELDWLPGYENSSPVRTGNAAWKQLQLDVYGEVIDAMHLARKTGLKTTDEGWQVERHLLKHLETCWKEPDEGIWEVRGPRRHFTHSKLMAWVALDRAIKDVEQFGMEGPTDCWRELRDTIHAEICAKGFDKKRNTFVQYYGGKPLDASLLMMATVGFLPAKDPRVVGTVEAIERHLMSDGFVARYTHHAGVDGLPSGEGAFLPCTFWLADNYILQGRRDEAREIFERLLAIRNDVGLLSEEYDVAGRRMVGNFPQAFSHVGLVNTARNLIQKKDAPAEHRRKG
jgi:GH15 family glucan-1,4-alpha-glucosidase